MAKRMLADVLWEAANRYLSPRYTILSRSDNPFSCNAVGIALTDGTGCAISRDVRSLLEGLGCTGSATQINDITGLKNGARVQGIRYMWLLLAMHVAEDEGIEVSA